jgi:hypothetical protein
LDIHEIVDNMAARHPWELSRTGSLLWEFAPFIERCGQGCRYLDLGAGDQFFDDALLTLHPDFSAVAVDTGYTPEILKKLPERVRNSDKIRMTDSLENAVGAPFDFILMLDLLEYIDDEAAYLRGIMPLLKENGPVLLCLPAFQMLFCEHDRIVRAKRRYGKKQVRAVLSEVPQLSIKSMHYCFTPLFVIRFVQKFSGARIDPQRKIIRGWKYGERSFPTRFIKGVLDLDYRMHAVFSRVHTDLPGLSLIVICEKKDAG